MGSPRTVSQLAILLLRRTPTYADRARDSADDIEIVLVKGKLEDIELPVKEVDIIISEVS